MFSTFSLLFTTKCKNNISLSRGRATVTKASAHGNLILTMSAAFAYYNISINKARYNLYLIRGYSISEFTSHHEINSDLLMKAINLITYLFTNKPYPIEKPALTPPSLPPPHLSATSQSHSFDFAGFHHDTVTRIRNFQLNNFIIIPKK